MKQFEDLSIRLKILIGLGLSFLIIMGLLMGVVFLQYNNLLDEGQQLLENQLLKRERSRIKSLVQTRAKMLSQIYLRHQDEMTASELRSLIAEVNKEANLKGNYFYVYTLIGETISLPPSPNLEDKNRWDLKIKGRRLVQEMSKLARNGGGYIKYPYTNPNTGKLEIKFGYIEPIPGTDFFVGAGSYRSDFHSVIDKIKTKVNDIKNETIDFLVLGFFLAILIISKIILIISNYINKHINELLTGFQQVINGRLDYKLSHNNEDEFQNLISGFNYMVERISDLTYTDPLTGLPNMNFLESSLNSDLKELKEDEEDLYLFTLGISNFDLINSNYGYHLGNELLEQIFLRLDEVIDEDTTIARKSNQFIFYFKSNIKEDGVIDLGEDILEQLGTPYNINDKLIYAEPKLGLAKSDQGDINCDYLINKSELALHFAHNNRENLLFYSSEMQGELSDRMDLESKLRYALKNEEFLLHYQPLLATKNNQILGVEALIRWNHPQEGMISPGEFIPLAEETGMIVEIGNWVLKEACQQLKVWQEKGYNDLIMSVNIAPQQFQQPDFVNELQLILEETGIDPQYLELEITERTVIGNVEYTVDLLNDLKEIGVKIAIDDFGTGYSSLEYLNEFALDSLKIDRAFIHNRKNEALVKTIIMIGDNLDLSVIAEGVETEEELEFLFKNGCAKYQGYLYSKPVEPDQIYNLIKGEFK